MTIVDEFIGRYQKEYDFYDQAARLVAQTLDSHLQAAGIRSIVTSRAKSVGRLEPKVRDRLARKNYQRVDDIYDDIIDLAGVRVALYFPAQRHQVEQMIGDLFILSEPKKEFPDGSKATYAKRFAGYSAAHYRARLRESTLNDTQKRYAEARVEIQVASVLMHAWAEVEHDLVYKPLQGMLSKDEYAVLDELNGLVMAGEIALERLQRAGEARVASDERPFGNHYELAAYLLNLATSQFKEPVEQSGLGRVDLLFAMICRLELRTPKSLARYVSALHADVEVRAISEQVIDQMLAEDRGRYAIYDEVRASHRVPADSAPSANASTEREANQAMGYFLSQWAELERFIRESSVDESGQKAPAIPSVRALTRLGLRDGDTLIQFDRIRRLRNQVVHGVEIANPADLHEAGDNIKRLKECLEARAKPRSA